MGTRVQPQRNPAAYRRRQFEKQREAARVAATDRREKALEMAMVGDPEAPKWAQIAQCYREYRPAQVRMERRMRRCIGGPVSIIYPGRRECLASEAVDRVVDAA